ncbi:MAG: hypothetical protein WCG59_09125 [Actinomycetes bacterium]
MARMTLRAKGQITLPDDLRRDAHPESRLNGRKIPFATKGSTG